MCMKMYVFSQVKICAIGIPDLYGELGEGEVYISLRGREGGSNLEGPVAVTRLCSNLLAYSL